MLQGLAGLVQQYSPKIGAEHVRAIISGLVGKTGDIVAAAKAQMDKVVAAMAAAAQARTDLKTAFQSLAQGALAAFDEVTSKWKPPSSILLESLQAEDVKAASDKAAADAAGVVKAAQDAAAAARAAGPQEGESAADFAARLATLDAAYTQAVLDQGAALRGIFEQRTLRPRRRRADRMGNAPGVRPWPTRGRARRHPDGAGQTPWQVRRGARAGSSRS